MTQPMQVRLCDRLLSGYSQPKRCNRPAVVIVDAGTPYALPLCAEHAAEYDASRLAPVPDSPIAAPTFYHYLGQWPDDYAAGGALSMTRGPALAGWRAILRQRACP